MDLIPFLICWYLVGMLSFFLLHSLSGQETDRHDIFYIFVAGGIMGLLGFLMVFVALFVVFLCLLWVAFRESKFFIFTKR